MSDYYISSLNALKLASIRSKGYTAEQIATLAETIQGIIDDINASLETCEEHVNSHASAEENVIVSIKKNGTAIAPTNKIVDISIPTKVSELDNDSLFATQALVDEKIRETGYLSLQVVETLPTASNANANTIYFVPKSSGETGNQYDEYMLVSGSLERIGDVKADLSGYITQNDVTKADDALITEIVNTSQSSDEKYVGTANLAKFWELVKAMIVANETAIKDLTARADLLELCVMNGEISGNQFYITFETLNDCSVAGVWNTENSRIDF